VIFIVGAPVIHEHFAFLILKGFIRIDLRKSAAGLVLVFLTSGGVGCCFVHQKDRDVVTNRIHTFTLAALQALAVLLLDKRLLADGTNQNVEKVLGNHGKHSTPKQIPGSVRLAQSQVQGATIA